MLQYLKFMCAGTLDGMVLEVPMQWHVYLLLPSLQVIRRHANVKIDDSSRARGVISPHLF